MTWNPGSPSKRLTRPLRKSAWSSTSRTRITPAPARRTAPNSAATRRHLEKAVAARTAELKVAEHHTRLILDSTADGIYGYDRNGFFDFVNPAACRLLGYTPAELIGRPVHDTIHHSLPDGSPYPVRGCSLHSELAGGTPFRSEHEVFWRANGQPLHVAIAGQPRHHEGGLSGAVVSFTDIRERLETEAALERALAAADAANQAKSMFLANMSHEIRTPMSAILGFANLLREQATDPGQTDLLDKIDMAGEHLLAIINDILDLSKIESGSFELEETDFQPATVLDQVRSLIADTAAAKGLAVELDPGGVPRPLRGDPTRLRQALLNLAINAVKFSHHGRVVLRSRLIASSPHDVVVRFEVQDTGVGISPQVLDRLFKPFEQGDPSIARKYGGPGLGLAIVKTLAIELYMTVAYRSDEHGTIFQIASQAA